MDAFSVPVEGGPIFELTSVISDPIAGISKIEFSPDGQHVAFQLYIYSGLVVVAALDGSRQEVVQSDDYATGISTFTWSNDGQSIIFGMEGSLHRWALTDGTITTIGGVEHGQFTPDKRYFVYQRGPQDPGDTGAGLWSMPLDGGPQVQLTSNFRSPNTVIYIDAAGPLPWQLTPDSTSVVYAAPDASTGYFALFRVPVIGGPPQQLTHPQSITDSVFSIDISPDSQYIVFRTGSEYPPPQQPGAEGGDTFGLRSVPLAGGPVTPLAPLLATGEYLPRVQISTDGYWVVYEVGHMAHAAREMYGVPIEGGTPIKLTDPQAPTQEGLVFVVPNGWIGDTSTFLLRNADTPDDPLGVCRSRIPVDGYLSDQLDPIVLALISADNPFVICVSDQQAPQQRTLFQVPLAGGVPVKLNGMLGPDQVVDSTYLFSITPDSKHIVYTAAPSYGGIVELYSVPAADR